MPLAVVAASGCVGSGERVEESSLLPLPDIALIDPVVDGHDHADFALHGSAANMLSVASDALNGDDPSIAWAFGELDIVGDLAAAATLSPAGGFVLFDVADPAHPAILGRYVAPGVYAADVKLGPQGRLAFLGVETLRGARPGSDDPEAVARGALDRGIHVVDISAPSRPTLVSFLPVADEGCHMLDVHAVSGDTYVFCIGGAGIVTARLVPEPVPTLVPVSTYTAGPVERPDPVSTVMGALRGNAHDITVYDDEREGATILYFAAGEKGLHILDVSDPAMPVLRAAWSGNDGLYVHTVMTTFLGERRITVAVPEERSHDAQPPMWVLDTTELSDPVLVSTWRIPGEHPYTEDFTFSTHNFHILGDRVYMAHFHAGVWAIDVSVPERPTTVGFFVPGGAGAVGAASGLDPVPLVWDVVPANGHLFALDIPTGLHVLRDILTE
ncbi:MAG: LVIVD repeat-containing protein [Methanobacteriota archaeon]